jgi:hypothetical protein
MPGNPGDEMDDAVAAATVAFLGSRPRRTARELRLQLLDPGRLGHHRKELREVRPVRIPHRLAAAELQKSASA